MKPNPMTLWLVWGAMLCSLGVYAGITLVLPEPVESPPAPQLALVGALLGVALVIGTASVAGRYFLLVRPARAGRLDIDNPEGCQRWLQISVLLWTASESVGLFGLVLWFLYREPGLLYPFLSGALLLLVLHAPRAASLRDRRPRYLARSDVKIG